MNQNRLTIVVLSRDDYNAARSKAPELLTDPTTTVVQLPLSPPQSADPTLKQLAPRLQPGDVLVRNPWDATKYVEAALAQELISVGKFNAFAEVCQLLGARVLEVSEVREVNADNEIVGKITFHKGVDVDASAATEGLRRLRQSLAGRWVWTKGKPDHAKARAHAERVGIDQDPVVASLLQQRAAVTSRLVEHELVLDITTEAQRQIRAALKVETLLRKLGPRFDGNFKVLNKHEHNLRVAVKLTF